MAAEGFDIGESRAVLIGRHALRRTLIHDGMLDKVAETIKTIDEGINGSRLKVIPGGLIESDGYPASWFTKTAAKVEAIGDLISTAIIGIIGLPRAAAPCFCQVAGALLIVDAHGIGGHIMPCQRYVSGLQLYRCKAVHRISEADVKTGQSAGIVRIGKPVLNERRITQECLAV